MMGDRWEEYLQKLTPYEKALHDAGLDGFDSLTIVGNVAIGMLLDIATLQLKRIEFALTPDQVRIMENR